MTTYVDDEPTERQLGYIAVLRKVRIVEQEWQDRIDEELASSDPKMTRKHASKIIQWLEAQPVKPEEAATTQSGGIPAGVPSKFKPRPAPSFKIPDAGVYTIGEAVFAVIYNRKRTRVYGKALVQRSTGTWVWQYDSSALERVSRSGTPITLGRAEKVGKLTGICAMCQRALSDPDSIARGIGPVCAKAMHKG